MLNKYDFVNSTEVDQFIDFLRKEVFSSASQFQQYIDDYKWPECEKWGHEKWGQVYS